MQTMKTFRLCEFIEEEFISAFEQAVNRSLNSINFYEISRVSQRDESELGYDGILTTLVPMYIQFKRSDLCTKAFRGKTAQDRAKLGLSINNGYFTFKLHKSSDNKYNQHNMLFEISQNNYAAYIAPLFFKKEQLSFFKKRINRFPWKYKNNSEIYELNNSKYSFVRTREFSDIITIIPHRKVTDSEAHSYTYSRDWQTCFHSEPEKEIPNNSLEDFLISIFEDHYTINIEEHANMILDLLKNYYTNDSKQSFNQIIKNAIFNSSIPVNIQNTDEYQYYTAYEKLIIIEYILKHEFNIHQFFISSYIY